MLELVLKQIQQQNIMSRSIYRPSYIGKLFCLDILVQFDRMAMNHPTTDATLCFIVHQQKIMLIMKKRGFGKGKINGPGGKIVGNESIKDAAIRETVEETGLTPLNPRKYAILDFYFGTSDNPKWKVHVFFCNPGIFLLFLAGPSFLFEIYFLGKIQLFLHY